MATNQYQREAVLPDVFVQGQFLSTAFVNEISYSSGARSDYATITIENPGRSTAEMFDRLPRYAVGRDNLTTTTFEITPVRIATPKGFNLFHGLVTNTSIRRTPQGEAIEVTARLDGSIVGLPVRGPYTVRDVYETANNSDAFMMAGELVFNPVIDDIPWPNKWVGKTGTLLDVDVDDGYATAINGGQKIRFHPVFAHHMQVDRFVVLNDPTETQLNDVAKVNFWTLKDVVEYLLLSLNFTQKYVSNPTEGQLNKVFDPQSTKTIANLRVPLGANFFEALTAVCEPYGVSFTVDHCGVKPRLFFYSPATNDVTDVKFLRMREYGKIAHHDNDEVVSLILDSDIANQASNDIRVMSSAQITERTFDLMPAWEDSYDSHDPEELTLDHAEWITDDKLERVHRDWVANEQGDYSRTTKEVNPTGFDIKRRREPLPALTMNAKGESFGTLRGVFVEYKWESVGWAPVTNLPDTNVLILKDELGIRFSSPAVPNMSLKSLADFQVRMTCSYEHDQPLESRATNLTATSWLHGTRLSSVVDMRDHFRRIFREPLGEFTAKDGIDIDDTAKMDELADALLDEWDATTITGSATLSRVNVSGFRVGNAISMVLERRLIANAKRTSTTRIPVVVGVKHDFITQNTILQIGHIQTSLGVIEATI